jgi:ABC-2 type transport system ATP-binding protein
VTKTFGDQVAVNDISLTVPAGSVYGFSGPNGSGKTTTLRMILHVIHPERIGNTKPPPARPGDCQPTLKSVSPGPPWGLLRRQTV